MSRPPKPLPSQEVLHQALDYDPRTGVFRWRFREGVPKQTNAYFPGRIAGSISTPGHIQIRLNGVLYLAHRLAWIWVFGADPGPEIDHKNLIPGDNAIDNLRIGTHAQNLANKRPKQRDLPKGVYKARRRGFYAQVSINGKNKHLGCFGDIEGAAQAYRAAATKEFGEFVRFE